MYLNTNSKPQKTEEDLVLLEKVVPAFFDSAVRNMPPKKAVQVISNARAQGHCSSQNPQGCRSLMHQKKQSDISLGFME